jgi:hypothetical protein
MPKLTHNPLAMLYHLIRNDAHKLEYDAHTQWKFHRSMSWYWLLNFPVVAVLFFGFPKVWVGVGLLLNTFYSLYANFATDYGAIPASYGAMKADEIQQAQTQTLTDTLPLSPHNAQFPGLGIKNRADGYSEDHRDIWQQY